MDSHHYETLYAKYLQPIAGEKLRLLEGGGPLTCRIRLYVRAKTSNTFFALHAVGLGCDMAYGPGHSLKVTPPVVP